MSDEKALGITPGMPAADDPARNADGTVRKGYSTNRGGQKPGDGVFVRSARKYHGMPATEADRKAVAATISVHIREVPERGPETSAPITLGQLLAWLQNQKALRGSIEPLREILDRTEPKPKRIEIATDGVSMRMALSASDDEVERTLAEEYFDDL